MKKLVKYLIISVVFFTYSCKEDYSYEYYDLGTEIYFSGSRYTTLDEGVTLTVNNPLKNLTEVSYSRLIAANGTDAVPIGTATFTDGTTGPILIPAAALAQTAFGTRTIRFNATYNGKPFWRNRVVTFATPFTVEVPEVLDDAALVNFPFDIAPVTATVTGVTVQSKVGINAVYTDVAGPWETTDTLVINSANFNVGDTIYINIIATTGTKTDNVESEIPVQAVP